VDALVACAHRLADDEAPIAGFPTAAGGLGTCTQSATDTTPTPGGGAGCNAAAPVMPGGDCFAMTLGLLSANNHYAISITEYNDGAAAEGATFGTGDCQLDAVTATGPNCHLNAVFASVTASGETVGPPPPPPPPPPPVVVKCKKIRGNARDNKLRGTRGCDKISAKAGDDKLIGKAGNDVLKGGPGFDVCKGGPGRDRLRGCETKRS
jgi:hypothetical protein